MSKFFLTLIAYSLLIQAGLVSAVRLRVLTVGADKCTPRKVAAIEAALGEAVKMADAAITALANPQVVNSESFINFLGQGNNAADISKNKFQTVKTAIGNGKLVTLTGLSSASANDVTFICPPDDEELAKTPLENPLAAQSTEKCRGTFFALARDSANLVRVCPIFFDKRSKTLGDGTIREIEPQTLVAGAKLHLAGAKIGGVPAITIVHEFQHLSKIVGNRVLDLESDVDPIAGPPPPPAPGTKDPKVKNPAYSVDQCKGLSAKNKILNAQNFAWFAFDVFADKNRGLPCGTTPGSPVASGSGTSKPGGATPPGSPKPPAKPIVRRAKTTSPKTSAAKVAAPQKVAAPKKAAVAAPKKVAAPAVPKKAVVPAAPKKVAPAAAAPGKVAKPAAPGAKAPVAAKPVVPAPKKVAAPKPNPIGGGTTPSGPRLARPARLSSSASPSSTRVATGAGAKNGAKVGAGATATSTGTKKPAPTGKVAPTVCKVNRRAILQPISIEGFFVG